MAQLSNLLVTGSSRLLGKLFCSDLSVGNSLSVKTLSATNFTATSITTSGLTVNGNATTTGTLNVGNSQANGKISINGKVSIRDYANNGWLGINDTLAWASGVYFGRTTVRTDGMFQVGDAGNKVLFNQSSAKFTVPVTINNSLAANNITATNVTVNDTLKAFKYELNTIQDLGGEFCVAPTIYIQSGAKVQVNKDSATTIVVSIQDTNAIKSDTIQGIRWAEKSKIKFQGKINGLSLSCNGVMKSKLNTVQNTMSLTLTVDSSIANSFSTSVANATSYSDISVMLYQRVTKNSQAKDVYYPVGIRMSATGSTNAAPYVDIWGSKSNSDPDTVYTIPSVRLGYLDGLSTTLNGISISCNGYGLYADNVYLNGTIMSNSGTIGGFKIDYNSFTNGTWGTDKSVLVCTGTNSAKAVGGSSAINGWCFTAGSKFGVTTNGDLYASNANISGTITSEKGKIGKYTITGTSLWTGDGSTCTGIGGNQAFWAGSDSSNDAAFRVSYSGKLVATNATISGDVTATSGTIGGFKIGDNKLYTTGHETWNSDSNGIYIDSQYIALGTNGDGTPATYFTKNGTGKIGGWTVYKTYLRYGDLGTNNSSLLCPAGTVGEYTVAGHTSTGWTLTSGSNFGVTNDGGMYCSKGNIGGWDIASNGFCKNLTSYDSGDPGTYLGIDGLRNNDIYYGISMNAGLLKFWKKGNFAGAIFPGGGYDNTGEDSYLYLCVTEQHQGMSFGLSTASTTTLGNIASYSPCYSISRTAKDYKNIFYHGVNIDEASIDGTLLSNDVKVSGNYYRNGNLIGETIRGSGNQKTIANATWTNTGAYVKLPAGVYVLVGTNAFAASKGGRLAARFADSTQGYDVTAQVVPGMPSSMTAWVGCQWIVSIAETTVYHLQAFQQTGSNLAVTGDIKAVRIA